MRQTRFYKNCEDGGCVKYAMISIKFLKCSICAFHNIIIMFRISNICLMKHDCSLKFLFVNCTLEVCYSGKVYSRHFYNITFPLGSYI